MFLTQGQLILCLQSISICISSNVISSNGSSGEGVCSGLASSATLAAASVGAGRGGACQTGRRSREVAVRAVNAGTRCIRRRGRAAPRPGAAGSRVHAVSGCPAAGKGPAGGRAARRGATGGWTQASGSFWRRPWTPVRPSPGPAAPPRAAPTRGPGALRAPPRRGSPLRVSVRALCHWDLLLPESQPRAAGSAALGSPGGRQRGRQRGRSKCVPHAGRLDPQELGIAEAAANRGPRGDCRSRELPGRTRPAPRRPAALLAGPAPRCPPSSSRASSLRARACSCAPSRPLYTHVVVPD